MPSVIVMTTELDNPALHSWCSGRPADGARSQRGKLNSLIEAALELEPHATAVAWGNRRRFQASDKVIGRFLATSLGRAPVRASGLSIQIS